jgi:hypothetical protein
MVHPLELCFEKLRFKKNVFSECRMNFRDAHFKNFLGGHAPRPP